jgi:hypothetical protein
MHPFRRLRWEVRHLRHRWRMGRLRIRMAVMRALMDFRRWRWTAGPVNLPGYHWEAWAAIMAFFLAVGSVFVLGLGGVTGDVLGGGCFALSAYVFVSFFLPLWLPRMRDERLVQIMREKYEQLDRERGKSE